MINTKKFSRKKSPFILVGILLFLFLFRSTDIILAASPTVTTGSASSITKTTASLSGSISSDGGKNITASGYNYGLTTSYGSTVSAATTYTSSVFLGVTTPTGSIEGRFNKPYGLTTDPSGNFYVSDTENHRIQKFDSSGTFVSMFGWGVDDGSSVFQTCTSGCQAGIIGDGDGQFSYPYGLATDSDGNVYVADSGNRRIQKFNSSLAFQLKFGTDGSAEGQFTAPLGVEVDSGGTIYIADTTSHRIHIYNSSGSFTSMFGWGVDTGASALETCTSGCQAGVAGAGDGQLNSPREIDIDSSGNIYVADTSNHRIQKFNSSGSFTSMFGWGVDTGASALEACTSSCQIGTAGSGTDQFNEPASIHIDASDTIFIGNLISDRIQKFNSSGAFLKNIGTVNIPHGITTDSSGNVYVTNFLSSSNVVFKFSFSLASATSSSLTCNTNYHFRAFATNADGTATGSDATFTTTACDPPEVDTSTASSITRNSATLNGSFVDPGAAPILTRGFEYGLTTSYGTTLSESGNEYVSEFGSIGSGDGQVNAPYSIARDSSGNFYVADTGNNRIQKFDSSGTYVSEFGSVGSGDGQFNSPQGVTLDSSGNIYVADITNNRIQKFNSSGVFQFEFGNGLLGSVFNLAVDSSGNIYVADPDNIRVAKFDSSGIYDSDFAVGEFSYPYSVDIDSSGNIYVADAGYGSVRMFYSNGTLVTDITNSAFGFTFTVNIDSSDNIYVADAENGQVHKFNSSGTFVYTFSEAGSGSGNGEFNYPLAVVADADGNIYVADTNNNRIQKLNLNFSRGASSLSCDTTYHYRTFASNGEGTGYGDDSTFTTATCSSTGSGGGGPTTETPGCTDQYADNYNPSADVDDDSCLYMPGAIEGCTDPLAGNHNDDATVDDGSCLYGDPGCMDSTAINYDPDAEQSDGSCQYPDGPVDGGETEGCMNPGALNFDPTADTDDGSCTYILSVVFGCTDVSAENFDSNANENDGSCSYINEPDTPGGPIGEVISGVSGFLEEIPDTIKKSIAIGGLVISSLLMSLLQPSLIAGAVSIPIRLWNLIPVLMGYKRKKRPWGTVYDSVTKQPLDPVYVTLKTSVGIEQGASITDIDGRYGFLAEAGTYNISASKDNYIFPSQKLAGKTKDDLYDNLYFGGPVELTEKEGVIYKNIPMDAINFNWNEFAKAENKKLMKFYSKRDLFFARSANILFIAGLVSSIVLFALNVSTLNTIILSLYAIILILRFFGIKPKQSGHVFDTDGTPLSFGIVRLFSAELNREVAHTVVGKTGKYYMLVSNGDYYMKISKKTGEDTYQEVFITEPFKVKGGHVKEKISL